MGRATKQKAALQHANEATLLRPILTIRFLPWWRRALRIPWLIRTYRQMGLTPAHARLFAFMALRSPARLARLAERWGLHA